MPPFLSDRSVRDYTSVRGHISTGETYSVDAAALRDTTAAAIISHSAPVSSDVLRLHSVLVPRNGNSAGTPSATIGIVLGSIFGFLVILTIIYVCYFRHYSTMYIIPRSRNSSTTSSKASHRSKRRRRKRKPVIAGLPRPREVIVVDVVRVASRDAGGGGGGEGGGGEAAAVGGDGGEAPAEAAAEA